ncbi:MAG: MBL fold metallo-hydrolase [Gammaproteobacteria bacterium]|nr:MBL fold metallo-hydrolase [Gammaproteobacteria bacterium]MBU1646790.1 MBL fold metallo-hydrolase [Gammaproteobacteria bacterium]MBU1971558.1 MBL fold metallo-hydrolase [Gammaproteobacteria bacterium]
MKPLMHFAAFLFLLATFAASASELRDHAAIQVAPQTWVIHGPLGDPSVENQGFMNNPAFVVTADGVVVVDPGSSEQAGRMVLRQIRKVTAKPVTHVLNTHVHGDHWFGNQAIHDAYPQAQIMAHPEMIRAAHAGAAARWLGIMDRLTQGYTRGTRALIPTIAVVESQTVTTGGIEFRIHAPEKAHSGTDIMIEVKSEGVMFLGDNVMNGRFGQMNDGTFQGNIAACDRALATAAGVFVPGHGKTGGKAIVSAYRGYLAGLFETVRKEYDAGKKDYEMKDTVKAAVAPYTGWEGFDIHFGRHVSVAVLELEAM